VNGTVDGLVAMLDLSANEDEHLYSSVVLLDEHVTDVLAWPEDDPELKAARFTLAVPEAGARTPNVGQLPWRLTRCGHWPILPPHEG
jgi:hypothetical protein